MIKFNGVGLACAAMGASKGAVSLGRIAYQRIGAVTPAIWDQTMLPLIRELQKRLPHVER